MKRVGSFALRAVVAAVVAWSVAGDPVSAQSTPDQRDSLRRDIERRFDVRPLRSGVVLLPKNDRARTIEFADDAIVIDGAPVTGAELRQKLGAADADLVLRLSYLTRDVRQQLFAATGAPAQSPEPVPAPAPEPPGASAPPAPPDLPESPRERRERRRRDRGLGNDGNDRVRFGGNVTVNESDVIEGDVVAIGGSVRVDGTVTGNAVAIGGRLTLGPRADVQGDAVAIGGGLTRDPGARIGGKVVETGLFNFDFGQWRWNRIPFGRLGPFGYPFFGAAAGFFALMSTVMRVLILCVLASLVLFVGRDYVERVGDRAAEEPLKAGAIGLLAQLLFLPLLIITILVLIVTIVGIPLLVLIPFALMALAVIFLIGFTAVAYNLGRLVNHRFDWAQANPYLTAATGILLLVSPVLIARLLGLADWLLFPVTGALVFLGFLAEYVAWTVGFGAVALLRFARGRTPPVAA